MVSWLTVGCNDDTIQKRDITIEAFSELKAPVFEISPEKVFSQIGKLGKVSKDTLSPSGQTAWHYQRTGQLLWVNRQGVTPMADTLLQRLIHVDEIGFASTGFKVQEIESDLQRFKALDFDGTHTVNDVVARLEYNLTKAYLTYVAGQRYGFVNPKTAINRVESKPDSAEMMSEVEPQSALYRQLLRQLADSTSEASRKRILVNMERCRWQEKNPMPETGKRVVVNVPAFMLYAFGPDSTMVMKIGCGATKTKTPLLTSAIEYMQVNPEWNIPQSIIKNDVMHHAGDSSYFARHRYYIADRSTGQKVAIGSVSKAMLASGKYRVSQNGGRGNSLGRIVFRFKNNFSVYLHDTSTPAFFQNSWRGVSG